MEIPYFSFSLSAFLLSSNQNQTILIVFLGAALLAFLLVAVYASDRVLRYLRDTQLKDKKKKGNYSIFPRITGIKKSEAVAETGLDDVPYHKLKKGFDILIEGEAEKVVKDFHADTYAVTPLDFKYLPPIPKILVKQGDEVKAGDPLFCDKENESIVFTAPVSGEIAEITRGDKRSIRDITILADREIQYRDFGAASASGLSQEDVKAKLLASGAWVLIRQRPFQVIADPNVKPKAVFVSTFDTAPLAADLNFTLSGQKAYLQEGVNALAKLTGAPVHFGLNANETPDEAFLGLNGVKYSWYEGKHPAGIVGIQIHHTDPIQKGEVVWTVQAEDLITIGKLFKEGKYDPVRTVAVAGPEVKNPSYVRTRIGANISKIVENNLNNDHVRYISGNVLTGKQIAANGHLGFFHNQLSVIEEGDKYEMFGWLIPSYMRPSLSRTFPAFLFPDYKFNVNTNTHGEKRAFVMTGQYEEVLPMDLYPVHLLKSIIANDFDKMEGLGIYEVVEEDLSVCEFVCTSKTEVQSILRMGMDNLIEQI